MAENTGIFSYGSRGHKSKVSVTGLQVGCQQGWFLLEALENPLSSLFQLLQRTCIPLPIGPFLHLHGQQHKLFAFSLSPTFVSVIALFSLPDPSASL